MRKKNPTPEAETLEITPSGPKKKSHFGWMRFLRRLLLLLFTLVLMAVGTASLFLHAVLNGPSPIARDSLTAALLEDSRTDWIPGLFLDEPQIPAKQEG